MSYTDPTRPVSDATRQKVCDYALAQVGKPYVWAAAGPRSFDCSGLVLAAWAQAGLVLPHQSGQQAAVIKAVEPTLANRQELQLGDVVFYYGSFRDYPSISHCALFTNWALASNGKQGRFVTAAVDEAHGVMNHWMFWALAPSAFGFVGHS